MKKRTLWNRVHIFANADNDFMVQGYKRGTVEVLGRYRSLDQAFTFASLEYRQHADIRIWGPLIDDKHAEVVRFRQIQAT